MALAGKHSTQAFTPSFLTQQKISNTCFKPLPPLHQRRRWTKRSEDENFFVLNQLLHPRKIFAYNLKAFFGEIAYAAGSEYYDFLFSTHYE